MPRFIVRTVTGVLAFTYAFAAQVAGSTLAKLDTEQKAAAAIVTANTLAHDTPLNHQITFERVIFYTNRTLLSVSSVTTPAALMATPAGVTVPCGVSGSLTARMAARHPRVLRFAYHDCHFDLYGWPHSLDGPGEVLLLSDSFAPEKVGGIRFGSDTTDLVQTRELVTPDQIDHQSIRRNLQLIGSIPLTYTQYVVAGTTIPFTYAIDGVVEETTRYDFPSGAPSQTYVYRWELDKLVYSGSIGYNDDASKYDEDLRVLYGTSRLTRTQPNYGTTSESQRFDNLRIHSVTDWPAATRTLTLDGKADVVWNPLFGAGCLNGGYSFKTRSPLVAPLGNFQDQAGDLVVNGQARATFYSAATVPPTLPTPVNGTLLHLEVQNVGAFNYDYTYFTLGLRPAAGCM